MNVNSNIISRYDDMLYENRPASLNEFLSNKYNNVHNELYKSALNKFIHSLVDKYVNKNFLYECFELLFEIDAYNEDEIIFKNIYENIFSKEDNSPLINYMLEELSIDRVSFFKILYETTVNKLNSVKTKLINFYRDENYDIKSAIKGMSEISDIHDFRFAYKVANAFYIENENSVENYFTMYINDNNEIIASNKFVFYNENQYYNHNEYLSQNLYYYIGSIMPTENADIYNDSGWYTLNDTNKNMIDKIFYIAIPSICEIYRDNIPQISLNYKSSYTFIKSIIINNLIYNIYITTLKTDENDNVMLYSFNDIIKIKNENILSYNDDYFDLICSENYEYIPIICEYENDVRIGYDKNGKWLLIVNDEHPIDNILNLENIIKQYMNYESKTLLNLYKNMICDLYKKYHKIIEIKNSEYWMPSHIRIINKIPPYTKINVDLSKYWNMIQSNNTSKLSDLKITNENMLDSELIGLNYVNGKAKVQSRTNDTIYEVPFKYLDENVNVSDEMILSNSFISKYNNL